ncbi:MAG: hypothetical protein JO056_06060 [Alphaproteobacteria bacterium]|uniref:hypothetical protein n=1 Tax=Bradyrhizobium sp. TaxID=376 RepID=UPI001EC29450|nr:hypothetical protein [Bradyrhizobium sp.]MBV9570786.1 hypothetical protein [Alphaproteobacteria bacterium]MBV9979037.1 hypothetical protein [Bradyrhizobium sp.]
MLSHDLSQEFDGLHARIQFAFTHEEVTEHFFIRGKSVSGHPRPAFTPQFNQFSSPFSSPGSLIPVIHKRGAYIEFGVGTWGHQRDDERAEYFRDAQHRSLGYPGLIPASSILIPVVNDGVSWDSVRISPIAGSVLFIGCVFVPDQLGHAHSVMPLIRKAGPAMAEHSDWEMLRLPILPHPHDENFRFMNGADKGRLQVEKMPPIRVHRQNNSDESWLREAEMLWLSHRTSFASAFLM